MEEGCYGAGWDSDLQGGVLGTSKKMEVGTNCCSQGEVVEKLWTGQREFRVMHFGKVLPMVGKEECLKQIH